MRNRTAVISGGGSGIGAACVERFVSEGWNVSIAYFRESERSSIERMQERAEKRAVAVRATRVDVTVDADCRAIAAQTASQFGGIDALVCSAGYTRLVPHSQLDSLTAEDFTRTTAVNTVGPFLMVRACVPALSASDRAAIVIVSSYGAVYGTGSSIAYAASKGATNTLTMSLARVLAPKIRVNAVCPALVAGGFLERDDPEVFAHRAEIQRAHAPLRKVAQPEDVAEAIYWLAARDVLMTGATINLDCGLHLNGDG